MSGISTSKEAQEFPLLLLPCEDSEKVPTRHEICQYFDL